MEKITISSAANKIRNVFNLTDSEFCQIARVTWSNEKIQLSTDSLKRIFDLLAITEAWVASGFIYKKEQLHSKYVGSISLFDALNNAELDEDHILFIGSTLTMNAEVQSLSDPFT